MSSTTSTDSVSEFFSQWPDKSIASSGKPARDSLKSRVRAVDPNHGRCLIENLPEHCGVDWVHCFPKRKAGRERLMASLEFHWSMPRGSLNLDTRYNVFPVRPHLRRLWEDPKESGSWILVPEEHIVDQYHTHLVRKHGLWQVSDRSFPIIENGIFAYRVLCISTKAMTDIVITRQDSTGLQDCSTSINTPTRCTVHVHPFDTLPLTWSHIHPKFAILEAGRKLIGSRAPMFILSLMKKHPVLERIWHIYVSWVAPCPDRQFACTLLGPQADADSISDSATVNSAKLTPPPFQRPIWKPQDSPKASRSQGFLCSGSSPQERRRCSSNLSGRALREHTKLVGKQERNSGFVKQWIDNCQPLEDDRRWEDPAYECPS